MRLDFLFVSENSSAGHVFVSYFRDDSASVDLIEQALKSAKLRVWRDTAELLAGEDWRLRIRQAITLDAFAFVACFSRASLAQAVGSHNEELALAIDQVRSRRLDAPWLIPVRLDDCAIPDLDLGAGRTLASIRSADIFGGNIQAGLGLLVAAIQRIASQDWAGARVTQQPGIGGGACPDTASSPPAAVAGRDVRISATHGGVAAASIYGNVTTGAANPDDHSSPASNCPVQ